VASSQLVIALYILARSRSAYAVVHLRKVSIPVHSQ
jgi:hypothetical protein